MSIQLTTKNMPHYRALMRLDKPIGIYLVAWPALWALFIAAQGPPSLKLIVIFLLGAFLMRSAGCVINDFADRNIDGKVTRTQDRPLATKQVSNVEALQLFIALTLCAALLLMFTNLLTLKVAIGAICLTSIYPFMKRYTHLPQVVLGMAFSCAVPMAFAATTNEIPIVCWTLYVAVVIWVAFYDTFYAMVDRPDDLKIGVRSTAILFGNNDKLITGILQIAFIALMFVAGAQASLGSLYFIGVIAAAALLIYQQFLIRRREPANCFRAFLNNHYVGMAIFFGIGLDATAPFFHSPI